LIHTIQISMLLAMSIPENLAEGQLLTQEEILQKIFGKRLHPKKFEEMRRRGLIPYVKMGHRTYMYDESAVRRALRRLRVGVSGEAAS